MSHKSDRNKKRMHSVRPKVLPTLQIHIAVAKSQGTPNYCIILVQNVKMESHYSRKHTQTDPKRILG